MRFTTIVSCFVALIALGGCAYLKAVTFVAAENTGTLGQFETELSLLGSAGSRIAFGSLPKGMDAALLDHCPTDDSTSAEGLALPGLSTIAVATVGKGVQLVANRLQSEVDALAARAKHGERQTIILNRSSDFAPSDQCLVYLRRHVDSSGVTRITLAHVAKIERLGQNGSGFQLQPVFLYLGEAIAITSEDAGFTMGFALSGQTIVENRGLLELRDIALGTYSVGRVIPNSPIDTFGNGSGTGLLAAPPQSDAPLALTLAVSELGAGVVDAEAAQAEIAAVAEAVRPRLEELVAAGLGGGSDAP